MGRQGKDRPQVWAHRGWSSRCPENTLAAFQAALGLGVDGIELDVHLTRDHEIVVIHDARLERTTNGNGPVGAYSLQELKQLDAGAWFHPSFAGIGIPTLAEVLELLADTPQSVQLNVEVKVGETVYADLELRVWQLVQDHGLEHRTLVSSFQHELLGNLKRRFPAAHVGLLCENDLSGMYGAVRGIGAEAIHPHFSAVNAAVVSAFHQDGIAVHVWTVDEVRDIAHMQRCGVDAVITNYPDRMLPARTPSSTGA